QAEDGIRDDLVTGVQTCALPISPHHEQTAVPVEWPPIPQSHAAGPPCITEPNLLPNRLGQGTTAPMHEPPFLDGEPRRRVAASSPPSPWRTRTRVWPRASEQAVDDDLPGPERVGGSLGVPVHLVLSEYRPKYLAVGNGGGVE